MNRALLLVLIAGLSFASAAQGSVDYVLTGSPYSSTTDFTAPCSGGSCANFPAGARLGGRFTVPDRLPANAVNLNVYPLVTSFSFSDGINVYASGDAAVRVIQMTFSTNANGEIVAGFLALERWLTGTAPHGVGDRRSGFGFGSNEGDPVGSGGVGHNEYCAVVGVAPSSGVADTCLFIELNDADSSAEGSGVWSIALPGVPVPTLAHAALALLAFLLAAIGLRQPALARSAAGTRRR